MTIDETVAKLRELGVAFWESEHGTIRTRTGRCPIVALADHTIDDRVFFDNSDWDRAAMALGIPMEDAVSIVDAADGDKTSPVRQKLLELCQDAQEQEAPREEELVGV